MTGGSGNGWSRFRPLDSAGKAAGWPSLGEMKAALTLKEDAARKILA
jgi:hypothetical protein